MVCTQEMVVFRGFLGRERGDGSSECIMVLRVLSCFSVRVRASLCREGSGNGKNGRFGCSLWRDAARLVVQTGLINQAKAMERER